MVNPIGEVDDQNFSSLDFFQENSLIIKPHLLNQSSSTPYSGYRYMFSLLLPCRISYTQAFRNFLNISSHHFIFSTWLVENELLSSSFGGCIVDESMSFPFRTEIAISSSRWFSFSIIFTFCFEFPINTNLPKDLLVQRQKTRRKVRKWRVRYFCRN